MSGVFLFGYDVFVGGDKLWRYVSGTGNRQEAFSGLSEITLGFSVLLVPLLAVRYDLFLRATYPPVSFIIVTVLFLFKMTEQHYKAARHSNVTLTESVHAKNRDCFGVDGKYGRVFRQHQ